MPDPLLRPRVVHEPSVEVVRTEGQLRVVAARAFRAGDRLMVLDGVLTSKPSRYSVQVDEDVHVEVPEHAEADAERTIHRYPWRSLNHACDPNARIAGRELLALKPIARGEEVTFDYETTEWDMASPFRCGCARCGGRSIRGFRWRPAAERERRRPWLAAHLLRRMDRPSG